MRVTDAQVHLWTQVLPKRGNYTRDRLEQAMQQAGVDRVVLVPIRDLEPDVSNPYALETARLFPERFKVMALLDLGLPDTPAKLEQLLAQPEVKGIRLGVKRYSPEGLQWIAEQSLRRGFPLALLGCRGGIGMLSTMIERNPDISALICHAALPAEGPDPFAELDQVLAMARYPNIVVKVSAMTRWIDEPYPFRSLHHHIRRIYDAFGAQRMAWGSDYSWEAGRMPYSHTVDLFREACDFLTDADREWILDKTISRVLRWND